MRSAPLSLLPSAFVVPHRRHFPPQGRAVRVHHKGEADCAAGLPASVLSEAGKQDAYKYICPRRQRGLITLFHSLTAAQRCCCTTMSLLPCDLLCVQGLAQGSPGCSALAQLWSGLAPAVPLWSLALARAYYDGGLGLAGAAAHEAANQQGRRRARCFTIPGSSFSNSESGG